MSQPDSYSLLETHPSTLSSLGAHQGEEAEERENARAGDGEGEGDEGEDVEAEEDDEEEEEDDEEDEAVRREKLADGFYEVEAIRRKRICKGVPQYLIKWRGWPESANTWEPIDNLHTCHDVVEAFEQSLCSEPKKSSRKRKRKFTQLKKKMQYSYGVTKAKTIPVKMTLSNEAHDSATSEDHSNLQTATGEVSGEHSEGMKRSRVAKKVDCNSTDTVSPQFNGDDENHGAELSDQNANGRNSDVHFQQHVPVEGDGPANCQSKVNDVEEGPSNQHRGAKRRKSGSVRRFTMETTALDADYSGCTVPQSSCDRGGLLGKPDSQFKKKLDSPRNSAAITRLIKPISYSTSVTNNAQDVSITFVAMRSDGKEVMVDNKFLRANNPHLLIDFYEQHLRYNPN